MAMPAPLGVTPQVWVHDQVNRVEKALDALANVDMSLIEVERLERSLTKAHARNLMRLEKLLEAEA